MKTFSMFSGVGGFELGAKMASEDIEFVGYSEIDKYAIQVYEKHFPGVKNYGNATTIVGKELPDFDLLVAGFPCQAFSVAGNREGFNETRGTLFFEIARILSIKRPRYLLLENVKGLLSHDKGKTFQTILKVLSDLGYGVEWQVLNSKDYGVPQNRERVFIVGSFENNISDDFFSFTYSNTIPNITDIIKPAVDEKFYYRSDKYMYKDLIKDITSKDTFYQWRRVYVRENKNNICPTLTANMGTGGHNVPLILTNDGVRKLSPTEVERLQGFPDEWTGGLSDTQRYKTLGNAVTTTVVKAVMERLLIKIEETE